MKHAAMALGSGLSFGLGLGISGIANPVVINGFLDLGGPQVDPTLLIMFAAAVGTALVIYQSTFRFRARPMLGGEFSLARSTKIDGRLLAGAVIFGFGWSLSGYCVGPALASLTGAWTLALPYLAATAVGMVVHDLLAKAMSRGTAG